MYMIVILIIYIYISTYEIILIWQCDVTCNVITLLHIFLKITESRNQVHSVSTHFSDGADRYCHTTTDVNRYTWATTGAHFWLRETQQASWYRITQALDPHSVILNKRHCIHQYTWILNIVLMLYDNSMIII